MIRSTGVSTFLAAMIVLALPCAALAQLYPGWDKPVGSNTTSAPYTGYDMPIPTEGGDPLTPEDVELLDALRDVADSMGAVLDNLNPVNPVVSNDGVGTLMTSLQQRRKDLLNLSKQLTPDGKYISMYNLKRMFAENGKNATGPEVTKRLAKTAADLRSSKTWEVLENWKVTSRLSTAMTIIDPGSKALGAAFEGDFDGAVVHAMSGTCKWGATTAAAGAVVSVFAAGTAPITVPVVIGSAVAAGVANYGFDTYIQPFFDEMNQNLANAKASRNAINQDALNAYKDVKLSNKQSATEAINDYIHGKISSAVLKSLLDPVREDVQKRTEALAAKKAENRAAALDAMHALAKDHPELTKDIEKYERGKLPNRDAIPLLKALQEKYGNPCKKEADRAFVLDRLGKLGYDRVVQLPEVIGADKSDRDDFYQCLCHSYSTMGTGISYSPDPTKDCQNNLPCKGGNWGCAAYDLPSGPKAWVQCVAKLIIYPEIGKDGLKVPGTGMRLDEYYATANSVRREMLEARKKAALSQAE